MRLLHTTLLLPLTAAVAVAACGTTTIDSGKAEDLVEKAVITDAGAKVKSVTCPEDKEAKKGATFTCEVVGTDGTKGDAIVTETDDEGNVRVRAPFVHPRDVERRLVAGIKGQSSVKALTVTCPEIIVGKAGASFECQAVGDGTKATVKARQTNGDGGFDYEVQNSGGG